MNYTRLTNSRYVPGRQTCTIRDYMNVQLTNAVWLNKQPTTTSATALYKLSYAQTVASPS